MTPQVSVCICTFKRSHLAETLRSVLNQANIEHLSCEIIVCDDDPARSAADLVAAVASNAPVAVNYICSGAGNVAVARNACLDAARGHLIAFLDDDETADPHWIDTLMKIQRQSDADVVKGYVRGIYPEDTPDLVILADPYTRDYGADGETLELVASGNVLLRRALIDEHHLRFNPSYGRSGGEDTDFFQRMRQLGAIMVASRSALVNEIVPSYRVTMPYFRARFRRMGQTLGKRLRTNRDFAARTFATATAAPAVCLLWAYPVARLLSGRISFRLFEKFWYSVGVLEGLAGHGREEMY
jgi:succinoglycan biosynthesis protein ExoM